VSRPHDDSPDGDLAITSDPGQPSDTPTRGPDGAAWRYAPGAIVAGRYCIVALVGRGGMGEVYRADDLTLDQPVALKFLPDATSSDATRLAQFHNELRVARQVSHKHVCRLYDLGEADGRRFLTMEYIDGDDLGTLLRRIGRFPQDRAVIIARQLCAGVAAAHDRGVIHRDLKPANVMIDRDGSVRIADFGIATAVALRDVPLAGTPQYMAPEQLNGAPASTATDIYSLGLVLFEIFTGKRVHEAETFAELRALHDTGSVPTPSAIVRDLDPAVERVILRCLDADAQKRPPSALTVAAALPGGQPLEEVLASGLTPSPQLLASIAESEAMPLWQALVVALAVLSGVGLYAAMAPAVTLARLVPLDRPPAVLADRAAQILASVGSAGPRGDTAEGFLASSDYVSWIAQADRTPQRWQRLSTGFPGLVYWYRTSPRELVPRPLALRATPTDPPPAESGMQTVVLDTRGRLVQLSVVPPQFDADPVTGDPGSSPWPQLFQAAGLEIARFSAVAPQWNPRDYADVRAAWEGPFDDSGQNVRVEASSYRGRPVSFAIVGPWTRATRMQPTRSSSDPTAYAVISFAAIALVAGAILLARHNVRARRADVTGATRLAVAALAIELTAWLFGFQHLSDIRAELGSLAVIVADALFVGALLWAAYVAIEPYCRRFWPHMLLGWSRLLTGHLRDARVGRDVLIGLSAGVLWLGIDLARRLLPEVLGYAAMTPRGGELNFAGAPCEVCNAISTWSILAVRQFVPVFLSLLLFLVLRLLTRRQWPAVAIGGMAIFYWWSNFGSATALWVEMAAEVLVVVLFTTLMIRGGVLPALVAMFLVNVCQGVAMTLDATHWSATTSNMTIALVVALTIYAFVAARAGEPLFGRLPSDV
jgi:hypothetical protein